MRYSSIQCGIRACMAAVLMLVLWLPAAVTAVDGQAPPVLPGKPVDQELKLDLIKSRIADLESVESPDQGIKAVLELYRTALARINSAQADDGLAGRYKQFIDAAPVQQSELDAELARQQRSLQQMPKDVPGLSQEELRQQLDQAVAAATLNRNRLAELEAELRKERLRPDQSSDELQQAKQQLGAADLKPGVVEDAKSTLSDAQRISSLADRHALTSRIRLLEMERLSHAPRLALLKLRIELAGARLKGSEQRMELLQKALNRSLAAEARKLRQATEKAMQGALDKHPVVRREAEKNSGLGQRLGRITRKIEQLVAQKAELASNLKQIRQSRERARQQVDIVGLDEPLGELLLAQNRTLPDRRKLDLKSDEYRRQMSQVRAQQFRLADELQAITQGAGEAAYVATLQPPELQAGEVGAFRQTMQTLIRDRIELLGKLSAEYRRHENILNEVSLEQRQLSNEVAAYQEFLSRNLVWIPSAKPLGILELQKLGAATAWLASPDNWRAVVTKLWNSVQRFPGRMGLLLLFALALIVLRGRMRGYLERVAPRIGRVNQDRYRFSLAALAITLMLALPPVLVLGGCGWLLYKDESPGFSWAVGISAMKASVLYLVLRFGQCLVIPSGLARAHLRWDSYAVDVYARTLAWFTPIFVITAFIAGITELELEEGYWKSLGRVVSILSTLIMLWFAHISLNPRNGALSRSNHVLLQGLRLRMLWYPLVLLLALVLLTLTFQGYHYTAVVLKRLLFASFSIGVLILLLHSFARRWLLVAQRRLALKQAKARRQVQQEAKAARQAAEAAGEWVPEAEELEAINLASVSEQTQRLLRMLGMVAFFLVMFLLWSALTPALGGLDEMILWQHRASGMADAAVISVSLRDLLLAVLVLVLMLVAVRNLPGLLEIAILQPLALEPGNRYAATSISRYVIFAVGFFSILNLLGISWDDVQWLVAAMGVGLGFGLKEIFANFFSGLIILFERPIRIGDTVTIGDLSGTVTKIRIRATTVTDWDNKEQVIPNQNFLINPLINWTLSDPITRLVVRVGIAYGSDTEKALRVMTDVVQGHPDVLEEPRSMVFFVGFGDSSLDFEARVFVSERVRREPLRHDLYMGLYQALAQAGIEIPFPQRDLHLRSIEPGLGLGGGSVKE
jgi:potassium-dependent mechanosensitive channel